MGLGHKNSLTYGFIITCNFKSLINYMSLLIAKSTLLTHWFLKALFIKCIFFCLISELDPSQLSFSNKQPPKKKRKSRTAFTNHQIFELEKRFLYQKYLSPADRDEIAGALGLSNAQVLKYVWVYNILNIKVMSLFPCIVLRTTTVIIDLTGLGQ